MLLSTCVDDKTREGFRRAIEKLGGSLAPEGDTSFTHFVTLQPQKGDKLKGFRKSISVLIALAAGGSSTLRKGAVGVWQQQTACVTAATLVQVQLIATQGRVNRGAQWACACLAGRAIVQERWVAACQKSGAFADAREHLLEDRGAEAELGFSLAAAYDRAQARLLLADLQVFLTPGTSQGPVLPRMRLVGTRLQLCCPLTGQLLLDGQHVAFGVVHLLRFNTFAQRVCFLLLTGLLKAEKDKGKGLQDIIKAAGGSIAKALPRTLSGADAAAWLVLGNEKDGKAERAWIAGKVKPGVPVFGRSWLVERVLKQDLDRSSGELLLT